MLPRLTPPSTLVRERRFATAQAGGASLFQSLASLAAPLLSDRQTLRRDLRHRRRTLGSAERQRRETLLCRHVLRLLRCRSRIIAGYLAFDGEPDIQHALRAARGRSRSVALPVIESGRPGTMHFHRWTTHTEMRLNRYRIAEPATANARIDARHLDFVFTPLVAFDATGTRLGMGAGYFDRRFSFLRERKVWRRPRLVGVAFDFQQVAQLHRAPWDVPLWAVITEHGLRRFDS